MLAQAGRLITYSDLGHTITLTKRNAYNPIYSPGGS